GLAAQDLDQFLMDDLDDLLGRVERRGDLLRGGPFLYPRDEFPGHRQGHVRLEQDKADLPAGRVDIRRPQPAPGSPRGKDRAQPVGECLEHALQARACRQAPRVMSYPVSAQRTWAAILPRVRASVTGRPSAPTT